MNFKNENNNNENTNKEVELNNNKGELKMNQEKQLKNLYYTPKTLTLEEIKEAESIWYNDKKRDSTKVTSSILGTIDNDKKQNNNLIKNENITVKTNGTIQKRPHKKDPQKEFKERVGVAHKELKNMVGIKPTTTIKETDPVKSIKKHKEAVKEEKAFKDMVKETPSSLLKIEPKKLNQKAFNYMVNLKEEDYKNNIDLTMKLINANAINTALRDLKAFNGKYIKMLDEYSTPYNITVDEFKNIAPTIYNMVGQSKPPELLNKLDDPNIIEKIQTKKVPRAVKKQYEVKYEKMLNEKQLLLNKNVVLTTELLWKLYNIQKGIKALEYIPIDEVNNYTGMVQALFKGLKWKKALNLLTRVLPRIRYNHLKETGNKR